ncbi:hypothetical protein BO86DRAFT_389035 [Aspergillus japonicus CBS 114.51]|uniref:Uncharacterized protein n=1 Tax=Aspergillus japonicus CBS 114.51 TaxID=1448312 RepID=A0A8T8X289_ASPJA|nr:hypothetical protein BO86DRAFT_389035 [Aspergillus japonicus CBS 114.51]RAH82044.1 hypothetical protein BO86DRAFT_389035 [Aspergillus japonicus CBS 114.51]
MLAFAKIMQPALLLALLCVLAAALPADQGANLERRQVVSQEKDRRTMNTKEKNLTVILLPRVYQLIWVSTRKPNSSTPQDMHRGKRSVSSNDKMDT